VAACGGGGSTGSPLGAEGLTYRFFAAGSEASAQPLAIVSLTKLGESALSAGYLAARGGHDDDALRVGGGGQVGELLMIGE